MIRFSDHADFMFGVGSKEFHKAEFHVISEIEIGINFIPVLNKSVVGKSFLKVLQKHFRNGLEVLCEFPGAYVANGIEFIL